MTIQKTLIQTSKYEKLNDDYVEMIQHNLTSEWKYMHFTDTDILNYFSENPLPEFPDIINKFKMIVKGEHKSDLFRYYYLFLEGGVFMDSDAMIYQPIQEIIKDYSFVSVLVLDKSNGIFQGFLGVEKGNPIIYKALKNLYEVDVAILQYDYLYVCKDLYNIYKDLNLDNCKLYEETPSRETHLNRIVDDTGLTILKHYWAAKENIPYYLADLKKYNDMKPNQRNQTCYYTSIRTNEEFNSFCIFIKSLLFSQSDCDIAVIDSDEFRIELYSLSFYFNTYIYFDLECDNKIKVSPSSLVQCDKTIIQVNPGEMKTKFINILQNNKSVEGSFEKIIGSKYSWNNGFIRFVNEKELDTRWGTGRYVILNNRCICAIWSGYYHTLSFDSSYTSYISILTYPDTLDFTRGTLIERIEKVNLFIFGDSHGLVGFNNLQLPHRNLSEFSKTMYRVGRDSEIINFKKEYNSSDSIFCLVYGEIDVRAHIGNQGSYQEACNKLVDSFIKAIQGNIKEYKKIIITAISPPTDSRDHLNCKIHEFGKIPFIGENEERVKYTQYMNTLLSYECFKNDYIFFDPYSHYTRVDGCLDYKFSDNCVHVEKNKELLNHFTEVILAIQ